MTFQKKFSKRNNENCCFALIVSKNENWKVFFLGYFRWYCKIHLKPPFCYIPFNNRFSFREMIILVRILFWKKYNVVQKINYYFLFYLKRVLHPGKKYNIQGILSSHSVRLQGPCCRIWTVDNLYLYTSRLQNVRYAYLICQIIWFNSHYQSALTKMMR